MVKAFLVYMQQVGSMLVHSHKKKLRFSPIQHNNDNQ